MSFARFIRFAACVVGYVLVFATGCATILVTVYFADLSKEHLTDNWAIAGYFLAIMFAIVSELLLAQWVLWQIEEKWRLLFSKKESKSSA